MAKPVLYCHGFPTCRLELVPSESIIQALDAPPRVIAIDRPECGWPWEPISTPAPFRRHERVSNEQESVLTHIQQLAWR